MKIAHLSNIGPRARTIINQGLIQLNYDFDLDRTYYSNGTIIKHNKLEILRNLKDYDLIIAGNVIYKDVLQNLLYKTIWYDFEDDCNVQKDFLNSRLYFKRSVVHPDRSYINMNNILPLDYCSLTEYYRYTNLTKLYDISYLFQFNTGEFRRNNVLEAMKNIGAKTGVTITGAFARQSICRKNTVEFDEYLYTLASSKIVFTAFPQNQDGDSRTWEAFASGALVFRDKTYIKSYPSLVDGKHFIEYDATDKKSILDAIDKAQYFLSHEQERQNIAQQGYEFIKKYHMAKNRVLYMLNHLKPIFI